MSAGPQPRLLDAFDPQSRSRIRSFAFKLLLLAVVVMLMALRLRYPLFETISTFAFWYAVFSGLAALARGERAGAPVLNGWDEMLAFFALQYLAGFFAIL
jgi:hypothetical protein